MVDRLDRVSRKYSLLINVDKTKVMAKETRLNDFEMKGLRNSDGFVDRKEINTIRYDMVDLCALKSWRDGQLNLAHGTKA